jgi:hypothetical protein
MTNGHTTNGHTKTITEVVEDLKNELMEFVSTRFAMLQSEFDDKFQSFKMVPYSASDWYCWAAHGCC